MNHSTLLMSLQIVGFILIFSFFMSHDYPLLFAAIFFTIFITYLIRHQTFISESLRGIYSIDIVTLRNYLHSIKNDWNYITPIDFYNKYYLTKKDYFLIDLRAEKEFKKMHIKGSHNIFWLNILDEKNLKILPKNKPIFLICYVGHTSSQVLTLLKLLGYNVTSIKYGYGLSPVQGVPVAGWLDYGLPTVSSK